MCVLAAAVAASSFGAWTVTLARVWCWSVHTSRGTLCGANCCCLLQHVDSLVIPYSLLWPKCYTSHVFVTPASGMRTPCARELACFGVAATACTVHAQCMLHTLTPPPVAWQEPCCVLAKLGV